MKYKSNEEIKKEWKKKFLKIAEGGNKEKLAKALLLTEQTFDALRLQDLQAVKEMINRMEINITNIEEFIKEIDIVGREKDVFGHAYNQALEDIKVKLDELMK